MKRSILLAVMGLLATSLAPGTGQAATWTVGVITRPYGLPGQGDRNLFDPHTTIARSGDTITWTNNGTEEHTVTAYEGAAFDAVLQPGQSFSFTHTSGATIKYRCAIHSWYWNPEGWQGMVGKIISPKPSITITSPANGATVKSPLVVTGTASDDTFVQRIVLFTSRPLAAGYMFDSKTHEVCDPCGASVNWSITLDLLPGTHRLKVFAWDNNGTTDEKTIEVFVGV